MPETNDVISHLYYDLNDKINDIDARVGDTETRLDNIDIAEATEPKVYVALLTQNGTDAPVATVLKNTLGGVPVWSYNSAGDYTATLAGVFIENKTFLSLNNLNWDGYAVNHFQWTTINTLSLFITGGNDFLVAGGLQAAVKIEVYP